MTEDHPFFWIAVAIWVLSAITLVSAVALAIRRRRRGADSDIDDRKNSGRLVPYLVSLSVFGGVLGAGAFFAAPGQMGNPFPQIAEPVFEVSPAASPLVLPDQPSGINSSGEDVVTPTPSPQGGASRLAGPFKVGFDSVGEVKIGTSEDSIERIFGEPTGIRPDDSLGKTTKAYVYEDRSISLTIYTFEGKVVYYSAASPNFETFSGVKVGDSLDKLVETYGSKLQRQAGDYRLTDASGKVVVFRMEGPKIERIEGGTQLG
jgi:hypothetical protein